MNISEAATATQLPPKTIRYYERIGLVEPIRSENGYRVFNHEAIHRLRFLGRARALGFSIDDCRKLLSLYDNDARASADVKALALNHIASIQEKIASLQDMEKTLSTLANACDGNHRPDCPILENFAASTQANAL